MPDAKISALPAVSALTDAAEFVVNDSGTTRKVSGVQLKDYTNAGSGPLIAGTAADIEVGGAALTDVVTASVSLAAGDAVDLELYGYIRNASGGFRTLRGGVTIGALTMEVTGSTTVANNNDTPVFIKGSIGVVTTSLLRMIARGSFNPVTAEGASGTDILRSGWRQSTANFTGTQTVKIGFGSGMAGTGVTLRIAGFRIVKLAG